MTHEEQLGMLQKLLKALDYIVEVMAENPVYYRDATEAYNVLLFGIQPKIHMTCPECQSEFIVTTENIGGLDTALKAIDEAIFWLEMELRYERSGSEPADGGVPDGQG